MKKRMLIKIKIRLATKQNWKLKLVKYRRKNKKAIDLPPRRESSFRNV